MNKLGSSHLTLDDRIFIQSALIDGLSCKQIASHLSKDDRTISREIKIRRNKKFNGNFHMFKDLDISLCNSISKFPFVCNGCKKRSTCQKKFKFFYDAHLAHENYKIILSDSRTGLDISLDNKIKCDTILSDGVKKGQSIHHIIHSNLDDFPYSERSIYRLVQSNKTTIQSIDLVRKVKLKPRKHYLYKVDNKQIRNGRRYEDFIRFISNKFLPFIVEIDTVESVKTLGHKCLLTIHFTSLHFMLIYVLDRKTKENVCKVFDNLKSLLGIDIYKKLFPVILTDRGTEFCDPTRIELDLNSGEILTHVFFCNSYASYQKGAIEENHELIRRIIPKSVIFDDLTQEKANLMASHINGYYRKSIDSTPYVLAKTFFGNEILDKLKIREILPDNVTLKQSLLR